MDKNISLLPENINRLVVLNAADISLLEEHARIRSFRKGDLINAPGEINRYTNLIVKGSARTFYTDAEGNQHNIQLGISNWWIGDYSSFITQQQGLLYTEALEATELISLSYESLQLIYDRSPATERFFRIMVQKAYASFQNRILHNLSMDAETRYTQFSQAYPEMDRHIAQKHIASYLGMSAEFLSKIKKRLVQKARKRTSV